MSGLEVLGSALGVLVLAVPLALILILIRHKNAKKRLEDRDDRGRRKATGSTNGRLVTRSVQSQLDRWKQEADEWANESLVQVERWEKEELVQVDRYLSEMRRGGHAKDVLETWSNESKEEIYSWKKESLAEIAKLRGKLSGWKEYSLSDVERRKVELESNRSRRVKGRTGINPIYDVSGDDKDNLDANAFEKIVAETFDESGYFNVTIVGGAGDKGVDITADIYSWSHPEAWSGILPQYREKLSVIVQCKYYAPGNNIGPRYVRELIGALRTHGADRAYLVTTSRFSPNAYDEITDDLAGKVMLIDGRQFNQLRLKAGMSAIRLERS